LSGPALRYRILVAGVEGARRPSINGGADRKADLWSEKLRAAGLSEHAVHHRTVMTELHKQGRYDRMSEDYRKLTGETPTSMADFVKLHAGEFTAP
jgi:hypothetical protein